MLVLDQLYGFPEPLTPGFNLFHTTFLIQRLVHVKRIPQQMRLVSPSPSHTLKLCLREVILQNWLVFRMRALLNNHPRSLLRTQSSYVSKTLLRYDDIEIVFRLVDMRAHGHDTRKAMRVCLRGPRRGRVHDAVFRGAEEIRGAAEAVEHSGAHDTSTVGVRIDVYLDGGVHADNAETADDFGVVGDLLGA